MIAILYADSLAWLPYKQLILTSVKDVPFALPCVTCVCHGLTWQKPKAGELLRVVRWDD